MTVADLINVCLELDQQIVSPRPSEWGKAAELVRDLAEHAEPSMRDPKRFGEWEDIDLSPVRCRAPRELDQPTIDRWKELIRPKIVVRRSGGKFDVFTDPARAEEFRKLMTSRGYAVEAMNVEEWMEH